jgi:hypothetical protein
MITTAGQSIGIESKKHRLQRLRSQMELERASFQSSWQEASQYILPRRSRFFVADANRGTKRYTSIIDSTSTMAAFTLAGGMMAGITSPARPWFRLSVPDKALEQVWGVKQWLDEVTELMRKVLIRSNLYNCLPQVYMDVSTFLTSPMMIEEDDRDTVLFRVFPIGSYYIAQDYRGHVNVFMRKFQMTVRQIVEEFGRPDGAHGPIDWTNISPFVKQQYEDGNTETWIEIVHFILPNEDYHQGALESKYKRFSSCYYENAIGGISGGNISNSPVFSDSRWLRESGYDYFPVLCPRWSVTGEDVYGTDGPGAIAIGDTKALQIMHKRKAQAVEKQINPPMNAAGGMKNARLSVLPGEVNYLDMRDGDAAKGFTPAYQIQYNITELKEEIIAHQRRIQRAYHEDTFRLLINDDRPQRATAAEIYAKQQEKMMDLGPVLEQLNTDMLDPLITILFQIMLAKGRSKERPFGMIPPPPQELLDQDINVEYVSIMAQAQKANALGSYDRFAAFVGQLAATDPSVLDVVNRDIMVKHYAEYCGVANDVTVPEDQVKATRDARAQQQAQQQKMEQIQAASQSAKNLADAPMDQDSALSRLVEQSNVGKIPA